MSANSPRSRHNAPLASLPGKLRLALYAAAFAAAALVAACAAGGATADCTSSSDCDPAQRCQLGTCFDECTSDRECTDRNRCSGGLCVEATRCASPNDCPFGTVCEDGYCYSQTPECSRDSDCPPGLRCSQGACLQLDPGLECLTPADCELGERCLDNLCVSDDLPDVTDVAVDTDASEPDIVEDTRPDTDAGRDDTTVTPDTSVDTGRACRLSGDCEIGELCVGGVCTTPDTGPADTGSDAGTDAIECIEFREGCERASQCCSGYCLGVAADGTCSELCSDYEDCNPVGSRDDWFCTPVADGGGTVNICAPSDFERACVSADRCLGGVCLRVPSASGCSWQCGDSSDCPPGTGCGEVPFAGGSVLRVCTPIGDTCFFPNDCLSQTCLTDGPGTAGYCSTFCNPRTPAPCPSGWTCSAPDLANPDVFVCVLP